MEQKAIKTQAKHSSVFSVGKAIVIILMVVGHSGCPEQLQNFIYLFHMPCFFFISGILFKPQYLHDTWTFVKRKFKGLWYPFVKWSLIFLALHNIFYDCLFYQDPYSWKEIGNKIFHIFTLTGSEQLLGGYWFLKELLYASLLSLLSMKAAHSIFRNRISSKTKEVIIVVCFVVIAYLLSIATFKIPTISSTTMLATAYYLIGHVITQCAHTTSNQIVTYRWRGVLLSITIITSFFFKGSMSTTNWQIFIYFIVSMAGTLAVLNFAKMIGGKTKSTLDYIGSKTLYVLTFHFLSFKLVSFIKILHYNLPMTQLSFFPIISEHNSYYWMVYSLAGIIIPLLICRVLFLFKKHLPYYSKNE